MTAGTVIGGHLIPVICRPEYSTFFDLGLADRPKDALQRDSGSPRGEPCVAAVMTCHQLVYPT